MNFGYLRHWSRSAPVISAIIIGVVITLTAVPARAASVGVFTGGRATSANLFNGGPTSGIRQAILGAGHTLSGTGSLNSAYLATTDIFITGAIDAFDSANSFNATAPEISDLTSWINGGGTFVITGERNTFKARYNSFLNPFGVTLEGQGANYNAFPNFINDPSNPYLQNGVSGSSIPTSNHGWYSVLPAPAEILSRDSNNRVFAFRLAFGSGQIIGIADTFFLQNPQFGSASNPGKDFLLNAIDLARAGGPVSSVPLPGALPLFASGLALVGFAAHRRRRRQAG